jgi:hypothetical protein
MARRQQRPGAVRPVGLDQVTDDLDYVFKVLF